jgi:hypothetical protein
MLSSSFKFVQATATVQDRAWAREWKREQDLFVVGDVGDNTRVRIFTVHVIANKPWAKVSEDLPACPTHISADEFDWRRLRAAKIVVSAPNYITHT